MLIYVNITDRQTDGRTDKHIKSKVRNLTKSIPKNLKNYFLFKSSFSKFPIDLLTTQTQITKKLKTQTQL
jgi:hypothetical protein